MKPIYDGDDEFGAVLNCAIRYCIGRATYMPSLVTGWIKSHCDKALTKKTLVVAINDIEVAAARKGGLGMECDEKTWNAFLAWLYDQEPASDEEHNTTVICEWIPTKISQPTANGSYQVVLANSGTVTTSHFNTNTQKWSLKGEVSHWMPHPPKPCPCVH